MLAKLNNCNEFIKSIKDAQSNPCLLIALKVLTNISVYLLKKKGKTPDELRLRIESVINFSKDEIELRMDSLKFELDKCNVTSIEKCDILKEELKKLNKNIDESVAEDVLFDEVNYKVQD